jgi:hypothetical protein
MFRAARNYQKVMSSLARKQPLLDLRWLADDNPNHLADPALLNALKRTNSIHRVVCLQVPPILFEYLPENILFFNVLVTSEIVDGFVGFLERCTCLVSLFIKVYGISSSESTRIFNAMEQISTLASITVANHRGPSTVIDDVASLLHANENIIHFDFRAGESDLEYLAIGDVIANTTTLRHLHLSDGYLSSEGIDFLITCLMDNQSIKDFDISECYFNDVLDSHSMPIFNRLKELLRMNNTLEIFEVLDVADGIHGDDRKILLPLIKSAVNIQHLEHSIYYQISSEFDELSQCYLDHRKIQKQYNAVAREMVRASRNLILLATILPQEMVLLIFNGLAVECSSKKDNEKLFHLLLDRNSLGVLNLPFKFTYLELLRLAYNRYSWSSHWYACMKKAINSPTASELFRQFADPEMEESEWPVSDYEPDYSTDDD